MRIRITLSILLLLNPVTLHATPALFHSWSKYFGDSSAQNARAVALDPSGNVWMTGSFRGTVNFGGSNLVSGASDDQPYLARFNGSGTHLFSAGFTSDSNSQVGTALACDASGNVILSGQFAGNLTIGGIGYSGSGSTDIFLAKFNSSGVHQWSKKIGDPSDQLANAVATDGAGNIYLTGYFGGTVDFGGGALVATSTSVDAFIAKYDPAGNHLWSKRFGDIGTQNPMGIAVDASGNIAIAGNFNGSVDFGGGVLTGAGGFDAFVARFTTAGVHVWSKRFGDANSQWGIGAGFHPDGSVIMGGYFQTVIDFGGGPLTSAGNLDLFLAKFDASGNHAWSKRFGDASAQTAQSLAVDAGGTAVFTGYFEGGVDFGGGPLASAGGSDIYLARFDNNGNHLWSNRYGDVATNQQGMAVRTDRAGNVLMCGHFNGSANFGGATLTASGQDPFLVRFGRPYPEIHDIVDVPGDQGGLVRIYFQGSGEEITGAASAVLNYYVFRRIDNLAMIAEIEREGIVRASGEIKWQARHFWREPGDERSTAILWESVASAPARQQSADYIVLAPTQADMTASSTPYNAYFVMAQTTTLGVFYDSEPDSGYSIDNLAPATPSNLAGVLSNTPDGLALSWSSNGEHDLNHYAVYRGASAGFVPSVANLIASPVGASWADPAWSPGSGHYYKVSAVDHHDNQSGFALLTPDAVTGAGDAPFRATYLAQNVPNPFNPSTEIIFGLEHSARVSLRIYDAQGKLVRLLVDGQRSSGPHSAQWDGRDDAGQPAASGVYFYRLSTSGTTLTHKMVLLK